MVTRSEDNQYGMSGSPFGGGGTGQGPLDEQSMRGFEQYSQTFSKYLSDKDEHKKFSEEEKLKRDRAKKANRIYKQICDDVGLKACFFSNFGDWSEYVDGRISETEFHSLATTKAHQMKED